MGVWKPVNKMALAAETWALELSGSTVCEGADKQNVPCNVAYFVLRIPC